MPTFTTDSLTISAGTHGDDSRFQQIVNHIYDQNPAIVALEYNPERLSNYLENGFKTTTGDYPIGDIYLGLHAAADTNTLIALIDTAEEIPLNAHELYDYRDIDTAIGFHPMTPYESRPYAVSRQAVEELRARHPQAYIDVLAKRDRRMAGHLQYLTNNDLDIFSIVGGDHLPGIVDRLQGIVDIEPELVTSPPIRTKLPPITDSNAYWVHRWLPNTTHPAKVEKTREESATHN